MGVCINCYRFDGSLSRRLSQTLSQKSWSAAVFASSEDSDEYGYNAMADDDVFPNPNRSSEEEAILQQYRGDRLMLNERWQSCLFRDNQSGSWEGTYELLKPIRDKGNLRLEMTGSGTTKYIIANMNSSSYGVQHSIVDNILPTIGEKDISAWQNFPDVIRPSDFSREFGNLAVGNAYTLGKTVVVDKNSPPQTYLAEIAIRDGVLRMRSRFLYARGISDMTTPEDGFDMSLVGFMVIKEFIDSCPVMDTLPLATQEAGPGIYDPPASGSDYCSVDLPGRLSFQFPRGLRFAEINENAPRFAISMLWDAISLRLQADRKFMATSKSILSFELTEITAANADKYKVTELKKD